MSERSRAPRDASALAQLERGLRPAAQRWRHARALAAARTTFARAASRALAFAAIALPCAWLAREMAGLPAWAAPVSLLAAALAASATSYLRARVASASPREVALDCDDASTTHDRLSAAHDLAAEPALPEHAHSLREQLAALAIEDGVSTLARLDAATLRFERPTTRLPLARALLALLALFLATQLAPRFPSGSDEGDRARSNSAAATGRAPETSATARDEEAEHLAAPEAAPTAPPPAPPRERDPRREPTPEREELPPTAAAAAAGSGGTGAEDEAPKESPRGTPKPSPARASGGGRPGGGSGDSSAGAAESQPEDERAKTAPPKQRPPKEGAKKPQRPEDPASSSAGTPSGASRGSGRMAPVGNQRRDAQRTAEREDEPEVEEEEIEDETEEQQQRGGVMPMTRQDQRAPARELSISGDGPPDQGRGGPTPPKKSRGTASLVLGIRLPDQVRGQPNPGTAKTNLEETPPRRQEASLGVAAPARSGHASSAQRARPRSERAPRWLATYHERLQALLPISAPQTPPPAPPENR